MPSCVFKHCKNCSQKQRKEDGVSFHKFPADPILRDKWIAVVRESRQDPIWTPSNFCVICSSHFDENDVFFTSKGRRWIKKESIPILNLYETLPSSPTGPSGSPTEDLSKYLEVEVTQTTSASPTATLSNNQPKSSNNTNATDADLDSLFDTPREACLKKRMKKLEYLRVSAKRKIKTLGQRVQRLTKRNTSLKNMLKELKDKKIFNTDSHIWESEEENEEILGNDEPTFENHSYQDYSNIEVDIQDSSSSKGFINFTEEPNTNKRQWTEVEDEYDAIGINVAAKLRNLAPNMRIIAEKLINDVLFQAQLNGLNSSTTLSTADPFKQESNS